MVQTMDVPEKAAAPGKEYQTYGNYGPGSDSLLLVVLVFL